MPELPEVATLTRQLLEEGIVGECVIGCEVYRASLLEKGMKEEVFREFVVQKRIISLERFGKYMLFRLEQGPTMIVHLGMSGRLILDRGEKALSHERGRLVFAKGRLLRMHDPRTFGFWDVTQDTGKYFSHMGPDALDPALTAEAFATRVGCSQSPIKVRLCDQHCVAGIGNIYADESLFAAQIAPYRPACSCTKEELYRLYEAVRAVLLRAVAAGGSSLGKGKSNFVDLFGIPGSNQERVLAYRRTGEPCCRCATPIERIVLGGRSTHYCPQCQK